MLKVKKFQTGRLKTNSYVLHDNDKRSFIIDPASAYELIINFVRKNDLNVKGIIATHGHFDHVGQSSKLKEVLNSPFFLHEKDEELLEHLPFYLGLIEKDLEAQIPLIDFYPIKNSVHLNNQQIKIIYTPGHTLGSICIRIGNILFTGDTIFKGGIGSVDEYWGNSKLMLDSIELLRSLPGNLTILPGHGEKAILKEALSK
ncbi:MAG: MBL fold metallo-hydrolase [Bacteroidia bacterium]|nr:MBL fold metallo-hydrolase [Bacteroidia bacterium]